MGTSLQSKFWLSIACQLILHSFFPCVYTRRFVDRYAKKGHHCLEGFLIGKVSRPISSWKFVLLEQNQSESEDLEKTRLQQHFTPAWWHLVSQEVSFKCTTGYFSCPLTGKNGDKELPCTHGLLNSVLKNPAGGALICLRAQNLKTKEKN